VKDQGKLTLISGEIESGKTRFCRQAAGALKELGWDVAGIVSPAVFNEGGKIAIDGLDLRSGERRRLADLTATGDPLQGPQTKRWHFSMQALHWCNEVLQNATPCDLLIIDELGPLEFNRGEGLLAGFEANDSRQFKTSLTVVRTSLLEKARDRWPDAETLIISDDDNISTLEKEWLRLF
jgi:nucleoside-triphosphatase THEP1